MAIVSSTFSLSVVQNDGRVFCTEVHVDNIGIAHAAEYVSVQGADFTTVMNNRAVSIEAQIELEEFINAVLTDAMPVLNYQTVAQFVTKLRAAYRLASQQDVMRLAWWLIQRINAGDVTDAQCQSAFGVTPAQWTSFKTNTLIPQHDHWAAVLAAQGA